MIQKLINSIEKTKAPIVVGLDPKLAFIPKRILNKAFEEYGQTAEESRTESAEGSAEEPYAAGGKEGRTPAAA